MSRVRTRYAPSPTGFQHVGGIRTALFAYLIAKQNDGDFILRIEDTDQARYVEGAVEVIYKALEACGLKYDEGPNVGGKYGPYVQTERKPLYMEYAKKLVEMGGAYYCFCSEERLNNLREEQERNGVPTKYDGHCKGLSKEEVQQKLDNGEPFVIRQRIPDSGITSYDDIIYGKLEFENSVLDDNVLIKSDGLPTYNFANVIDDHLMEITHVVRGNEYLSSTPKYTLLYKSFGWPEPVYVHVPQIIKADGKKLSKRHGDASFFDLVNRGYIVEAIVNYIALLGWSPGGTREKFTLEELVKEFSIANISKSPAIFDLTKLNWLNGEYLREMSLEEFHKLSEPYIKQTIKNPEIDFMKVSEILHTRTEVLGQIPEMIDFIEKMPEDYDINLYVHQKMKTDTENSLVNLQKAYGALEAVDNWNGETIDKALTDVIQSLDVKNGQVLYPVRVALSGKEFTPGGSKELAIILGKEESLRRIKLGIDKLSK